MNTPTPLTITHPVWLIHLQQHSPWWIPIDLKISSRVLQLPPCSYKHKSTHLVNAFLLVHHPSAHCIKQPSCPSLHCSEARPRRPSHVLRLRVGERGREWWREGRERQQWEEGGGGMWEQERKEWEETEAEGGKRKAGGRGDRDGCSVLPLL